MLRFLQFNLGTFLAGLVFFNYIIFYFSNSSTFMALWKDEMNTSKYVCVDVLAKWAIAGNRLSHCNVYETFGYKCDSMLNK